MLNSNGKLMIKYTTHISNIKQNTIHIINFRDQRSTIDYIVRNRNIELNQIPEIRTLNSANNRSAHSLLYGKIRTMFRTQRINQQNKHKNKCRIIMRAVNNAII